MGCYALITLLSSSTRGRITGKDFELAGRTGKEMIEGKQQENRTLVSAKSEDKIIQVKDRHDEEMKQMEKFCQLGSIVVSKRGAYDEVQCRVKMAWIKWRNANGVV